MSRQKRLALAMKRLGEELPTLASLVDVPRVQGGEAEELLVAAARIEAALPTPGPSSAVELSLLFLAGGDRARSRRHAEEAARAQNAEPEVSARAHALLGRLDELAYEPLAALGHYRLAADLDPASWRHQLDLAAILVDIGEEAGLEEAGGALTVAAALAGDLDPIAHVRAQWQVRRGRRALALATFEELATQADDPVATDAARWIAALRREDENE